MPHTGPGCGSHFRQFGSANGRSAKDRSADRSPEDFWERLARVVGQSEDRDEAPKPEGRNCPRAGGQTDAWCERDPQRSIITMFRARGPCAKPIYLMKNLCGALEKICGFFGRDEASGCALEQCVSECIFGMPKDLGYRGLGDAEEVSCFANGAGRIDRIKDFYLP